MSRPLANPIPAHLLLAAILTAPLLSACGPVVFAGQTARIIESSRSAAPTSAPPHVEITDDAIVIREKIQFDYNHATIRPQSDSLLREIAKVINDNPRLKMIRIEGHASAEGEDDDNQALSERRAAAVMTWLTSKGKVTKGRLSSVGFGESRPIADNDTETGREANRRVEFIIVEQDVIETKTTTDPNTGEVKTETTSKVKTVG